MTADEFVKSLELCRPSVEAMVQHGWLAEVAAEVIRGLTINAREDVPRIADNPLLDLVQRYDTAEFRTGAVTLCPENMTHIDQKALAQLGLILVGAEENWPLVLCVRTGEVWLVSEWDYARRAYRYAASPGQFLDALLLAAQYERPHVCRPPAFELRPDQQAENDRAASEQAARCAAAAGLRPDEPNPYRAVLGLLK